MMPVEHVAGSITRVDRIWMLAPFKKAIEKRQRETALLDGLYECVQQLFADPQHPGLNLEVVGSAGLLPLMSARVSRACRLILVPLTRKELGLLYFDSNHDEAYRWVDRNKAGVAAMLARDQEVIRGTPLASRVDHPPVIGLDPESPLAIRSAEQFREMLEAGVERYLTYLDEEQQALVNIRAKGLLLVKGGAGTGKTAVAIDRVRVLADRPVLPGAAPERVLYLCYNSLMVKVVTQLLESLYDGALPDSIEVKTFHTWCYEFLSDGGSPPPPSDDAKCRQAVYRAFGELAPQTRAALAGMDGRFVDTEIEQVIKHNGLPDLDRYIGFNRRGRGGKLEQAARRAVWEVLERATTHEERQGVCRHADLPLKALRALEGGQVPPQYRAIVIDEGQDCSPVMVRLARALLKDSGGPLMVFADPAQGIYEHGFQWTQQELRPKGGNVRWLRKTYRTTRGIYDLARSLVLCSDELREDLAKAEPPHRTGPTPMLLVARNGGELQTELVERISREAGRRPPNQIGVLAPSWEVLHKIEAELRAWGVPVAPAQKGGIRLAEPTVKLLTIHSAKGLDFPSVYVLGPHKSDLGGVRRGHAPETRQALYVALTRSSEHLTIGVVEGEHHPLVEALDGACYELQGSRARSFANLRGWGGDAPTA